MATAAQAGNVNKADELCRRADKKLKSFGVLSIFGLGSSSSRYEEAADNYQKAANLYKLSKQWKQAGDTFVRISECNRKLGNSHDAATNFVDAANAFKKVSSQDAVDNLRQATDIFTDLGRFQSAAKHTKEIAEIYENDCELEHAIENYQIAADFYSGEESMSAANQCLIKVAQYSAQLENYQRAIEIYEQVGSSSLDSPLLKWSVKDYFLKAGLCHLCIGDIVTASKAIDRYKDMDVTFASQRECKFLEELCQAHSEYDVDLFTQTVSQWDSISQLDAWKTSILLRIKNKIKECASDLT